uniref:Uncharacterized protein n=1 Tax=Glossina pallidipes TaxID=7398 RepID=A0A1A9ZEE4_GLOPL
MQVSAKLPGHKLFKPFGEGERRFKRTDLRKAKNLSAMASTPKLFGGIIMVGVGGGVLGRTPVPLVAASSASSSSAAFSSSSSCSEVIIVSSSSSSSSSSSHCISRSVVNVRRAKLKGLQHLIGFKRKWLTDPRIKGLLVKRLYRHITISSYTLKDQNIENIEEQEEVECIFKIPPNCSEDTEIVLAQTSSKIDNSRGRVVMLRPLIYFTSSLDEVNKSDWIVPAPLLMLLHALLFARRFMCGSWLLQVLLLLLPPLLLLCLLVLLLLLLRVPSLLPLLFQLLLLLLVLLLLLPVTSSCVAAIALSATITIGFYWILCFSWYTSAYSTIIAIIIATNSIATS